jgi:hypothetical protein
MSVLMLTSHTRENVEYVHRPDGMIEMRVSYTHYDTMGIEKTIEDAHARARAIFAGHEYQYNLVEINGWVYYNVSNYNGNRAHFSCIRFQTRESNENNRTT